MSKRNIHIGRELMCDGHRAMIYNIINNKFEIYMSNKCIGKEISFVEGIKLADKFDKDYKRWIKLGEKLGEVV